MEALIHMLRYMPANTTADEESKTVDEMIGEDSAKALLKTVLEAIEVMKVETVGNTPKNEKAEAILNMPA